MDPITVLAAVGTTLKIVKEVWQGAQWMQRIYETYTEGDQTLQSLALECNIYGESIKAIGQWLRKHQSATDLTRQMRTTHNAITLIQVSMANVLLDMRRFQTGGTQKMVKDTKISREKQNLKMFQQFIMNKAKQQWFAETMTLHLREVRAHAATLHLTLSVIELAGHTPKEKEKAPETLEVKTGKLERRLMLRQIITKALEIKRTELAKLPGAGNAEQSPLNTIPSSAQKSPQKLTFYDVVQLARQQAFAEKTRKLNEDLIDLSDSLQPQTDQPTSSSASSDLALLDFCDPKPSQQIDPLPPSQPGPHELDASLGNCYQPAIAELDAAPQLKSQTIDLLGSIEVDAVSSDGLDKNDLPKQVASTETPNQTKSEVHELCGIPLSQCISTKDHLDLESPDRKAVSESVAMANVSNQAKSHIPELSEELLARGKNTIDQPGLEVVGTDNSLAGVPESKEAVSTVHIETTDKTADNQSLASSIAPSIFSHSSSLTSATGCSLPGITEEEMQARNFSDDQVSLQPSQPQISDIDEPDKQGFPWIVKAARDGKEELVRKLLISGANIEATHTSTRRDALAEASIAGHDLIVKLLIEEGCPLDCADADGNTALHHASRKGNLATVRSLVKGGAAINLAGPDSRSALHLAMEAPHQNVVMLLIQHKANVNARDASFRTPLHIGASQGNIAMCNYLLNEGAQLDSREANSKTPLQLACEAGHYELVQLMLDQAKLNAANMTFLTAFFAAVEHGHVRIAESFFSHGLKLPELRNDIHKPLTLAAKSGCLDMVELMIREGCDINAKDDRGWNALHFASYHGHYQVIDRLFAGGVSAKATTSRKETPLLFAVKGNHFPVAERLLRGNNESSIVSAEDERGQQPVHHAVRAGSLQILNLLISNGAKINVENSFGWQPLHIATAYGHLDLVERLLQQGANAEEKLGTSSIKKDQTHRIVEEGYWAEARWPYPGSRPLHLACEYEHGDIAGFLVSKGVKMEASCSEGWQTLHLAAYFGCSALVEILLQGGVNPHASTNEGKTAATLGFCTTGTPIPEEDKQRVQSLLKEAMTKVKKQKNFKVALKKASTVEDKNNLIRAARFSMTHVSKPQLHRAKTAAQVSDASSIPSSTTSSPLRPRLPRLSQTSPLPLPSNESASTLTMITPATPNVPHSNTENNLPVQPTADSQLESTGSAPSTTSTTKEVPESSTSENALALTLPTPSQPSPETQIANQAPMPKPKRRTTFNFAKVDVGKLARPPTFDLGKQTLELGTKTLEISKQGFEISKQGLGKGMQGIELGKRGVEALQVGGLEMGKQGKEVGRKGVEAGKAGYKKAKSFARRGKGNKGVKGNGGNADGEKGVVGDDAGVGEEDIVNGDDEDKRSEFSLGDFAELGNDDF